MKMKVSLINQLSLNVSVPDRQQLDIVRQFYKKFEYNKSQLYKMLNWLLIISITLVSTTMLAFLSAYLAILPQSSHYYNASRSQVLLLSNSFNIFYIIITPLLFTKLKKHYSALVYISVLLTAIGCVGRYLCTNNYTISLIMSILVAIGHIPIITAPYGLLELFPNSQKGYAASIPLFVPSLGINFSILFGMTYIASQFTQIIDQNIDDKINSLNLIIAVLGFVSCALTVLCMHKLKQKIWKINQYTVKNITNNSLISMLKTQLKGGFPFYIMLIGWGTILGLNWTYGGMFGVFFSNIGLPHKDIAMLGLYANLSTVFLSNLGSWISNATQISNSVIIFALNIVGFTASLYLQASVSIDWYFLRAQIGLIIAIIVLRAALSSFVSLSLIQLSHNGSSVLISAVFFYVANISNLFTIYLVDYSSNELSLTVMSAIILICILIVFLAERRVRFKQVVFQHSDSTLKTSSQQKSTQVCDNDLVSTEQGMENTVVEVNK